MVANCLLLYSDSEDRAEKVEKKKQQQLKNQGKAEWDHDLASNSESIVCAVPFPWDIFSVFI